MGATRYGTPEQGLRRLTHHVARFGPAQAGHVGEPHERLDADGRPEREHEPTQLQSFYIDASEPATEDLVCDAPVDIERLRSSAAANPRAITLLGPPPFKS